MFRVFLTAIALLGTAVSVRADIVDFETGSFALSPGQTGGLEGFNFTAGGPAGAVIIVPVMAGTCTPSCVSDGTKTMGLFNDANVTIAPSAGGTFSLSAFDVAGTFAFGNASRNVTSLEVIGNLFGGGQVTETFVTDPNAFQTFALLPVFTNLASAEFLGLTPAGAASPEFQLDNIVVARVPEPTSVILLGTLVLLLGPTLFRRLTA